MALWQNRPDLCGKETPHGRCTRDPHTKSLPRFHWVAGSGTWIEDAPDEPHLMEAPR
jgi:hypothetical protein